MDSRAPTSPATWCSCIQLPGQQINQFTPSIGFCCTPSPPPVPLAQLPTPALNHSLLLLPFIPSASSSCSLFSHNTFSFSLFLAELCPLPLCVWSLPPWPLSLHFGCSPPPPLTSPHHFSCKDFVQFPLPGHD